MRSVACRQTGETLLDHMQTFGGGDIEIVSERRGASVPKVVQSGGLGSQDSRCVAAQNLGKCLASAALIDV
jgi:hypothetical protein